MSIAVFAADEMQPLLSCRVRTRLQETIQLGLPNHVANTIADQHKQLNNVRREGRSIESQGSHFRDMRPQ